MAIDIDKNKLWKHIEKTIMECAGELKAAAKSLAEVKGRNKYSGTFANVGKILWEDSDAADLVSVSKYMGELRALFDLADAFHIHLTKKVNKFRNWCDVLNPCD